MVYRAVPGYYNHSNKKHTTEKITYSQLACDESLCRTWSDKIRG